MTVTILGAGVAGLAVGYALRKEGISCAIFEQSDYIGGLCSSFQIQGFTFDNFIHLSFTRNPTVRSLFDNAGLYLTHAPESQNYWNGEWIRHPAQNNLYHLPTEEKIRIIKGFIKRNKKSKPQNYEQWLRLQYGDYFSESFPMEYTKKYWCSDARELETKWVGERLTKPDLDDILRGAFEKNTKNNYYASEMRYPEYGGFETFLTSLRQGLDIRLNKKVAHINPSSKEITFADGSVSGYETLISTIPLPDLCRCLNTIPKDVHNACERLSWTQGHIVSIGLKNEPIYPFEHSQEMLPPALWFYAYDKDIPFSRCYFPHQKSPKNAPVGFGAIQAECYAHCRNTALPHAFLHPDELGEEVVDALKRMQMLHESDILFVDVRHKPYANVIFDHSIYEARQIILDYMHEQGINCAGRFGEWDYLWSDQSVISGISAAKKIMGDGTVSGIINF